MRLRRDAVCFSSVDCEFEFGTFYWILFELGSGFISTDSYQHGFFSASIKLPRGYTAGVVVAFYISFLIGYIVACNCNCFYYY